MSLLANLSLGLRRRMPVILQTEGAECGLACLAMVLGHHGVTTDLATLRQRHAISLKGITFSTLALIAQDERLGSRPVRLELDELASLRMPAVLHWELNHFVVLKEVTRAGIVVYDPAFGVRRLNWQEVSRAFTGAALELWPDPGFAPRVEKTRISLQQLVGQVSGFWPSLSQVLLLSLAIEVFVLVGPLFMQWIIDHVIVSRDADLMATLAIGFLVLLGLHQGVGLVRSWLLLSIKTSIKVQWRANIFSHLLRLPLGYFQKRHLGDVVSRTGSIDEIQRTLTDAFVEAVFDGLLVILTLLMMFVYSPALAWISILAVALYLGVRILWLRPFYAATEQYIVRNATLSTHFLETLRGVRAIKLFGRQLERQNAWQTLMISETNANLTIQKLQIFYRLIKALLNGVFHILILWFGALQILGGTLSIGMLMAFLAYRMQFDSRVTGLIAKCIDLKMLQLYAERLADVVLTAPESEGRSALSTHDAAGRGHKLPDIAVDALRFRYAEQEPYVLDGVSFSAPAGQSVAVVGASGCGKTTLVNLMLGVLQPAEGTIRVDGIPLDKLGNSAWRRLVGTVMQDDTLFAGSIAENISFFDPRSDIEWLQECARLAAIHDDIEAMPMGYHTLVGDMGTVLSGGQKQRVLLARALYKKPRLLILDEATSHLDLKREAQVNNAIAALNITRIVVAHRPETIASVQRVVELDHGKVVFDGASVDYFDRLKPVRPVLVS